MAPQADAPDLKARGHASVGLLVRGHHFRQQHPEPLLLSFRALLECTAPPSARETRKPWPHTTHSLRDWETERQLMMLLCRCAHTRRAAGAREGGNREDLC